MNFLLVITIYGVGGGVFTIPFNTKVLCEIAKDKIAIKNSVCVETKEELK